VIELFHSYKPYLKQCGSLLELFDVPCEPTLVCFQHLDYIHARKRSVNTHSPLHDRVATPLCQEGKRTLLGDAQKNVLQTTHALRGPQTRHP
jgi:hypothetical protein